MTDSELREAATLRLEESLRRAGVRDPRGPYRELLRELKARDPAAYREAAEYYEQKLLREVVRPENDPLLEWVEYGRLLTSLFMPGEAVQIDATGRSSQYSKPADADALILHLPTSRGARAIVIAQPAALSVAQHATHDLLVDQDLT
jgi:hypothetical protein